MTLEVNLQVALSCESVTADVALVRPLTGVTSNVDLKCRIRTKDFSAVATSVLEKGLTFLVILLLTHAEVCQVVGQETLTSIVEDSLSPLLKKFK